jgi:hypothetical protein
MDMDIGWPNYYHTCHVARFRWPYPSDQPSYIWDLLGDICKSHISGTRYPGFHDIEMKLMVTRLMSFNPVPGLVAFASLNFRSLPVLQSHTSHMSPTGNQNAGPERSAPPSSSGNARSRTLTPMRTPVQAPAPGPKSARHSMRTLETSQVATLAPTLARHPNRVMQPTPDVLSSPASAVDAPHAPHMTALDANHVLEPPPSASHTSDMLTAASAPAVHMEHAPGQLCYDMGKFERNTALSHMLGTDPLEESVFTSLPRFPVPAISTPGISAPIFSSPMAMAKSALIGVPTSDKIGSDPMSLTQEDLGRACRRLGLSSTGRKDERLARLISNGKHTREQVQKLVSEYNQGERHHSLEHPASRREPSWTSGESYRLVSILSDPRYSTDFHYLYNKPESRGALDARRIDPFSAAFLHAFNDENYYPEAPDAAIGITEDVLDKMAEEAKRRPHILDGTTLAKRWRTIRTKFCITWRAYTKSGQQNSQSFTDFIIDPGSVELNVTMWCAACFHGKPSLDEAVRFIPLECAAEEGVDESARVSGRHGNRARSLSEAGERGTARKRVRQGDTASEIGSSVIEPLANALARPVTISYATSPKKKLSATGRKLEENALARDFADTVATLMKLEETLERKLSKVTEADSSPASISSLRRRLHIVQKKIKNAEEPISNCDAESDSDGV